MLVLQGRFCDRSQCHIGSEGVRKTSRASLVPQTPAWEFILSVMGSLVSLGMGSISLVCIPNVDIENEGNLSKKFKVFEVGNMNYGGLEINEYYEIFDVQGEICKNIHAFGIPTEGPKYFTMVLGRPNMESTFLLDGNNLANIILDKMYTGQLLKEVVHVNTTE